jgi:hypothetical protein
MQGATPDNSTSNGLSFQPLQTERSKSPSAHDVAVEVEGAPCCAGHEQPQQDGLDHCRVIQVREQVDSSKPAATAPHTHASCHDAKSDDSCQKCLHFAHLIHGVMHIIFLAISANAWRVQGDEIANDKVCWLAVQ